MATACIVVADIAELKNLIETNRDIRTLADHLSLSVLILEENKASDFGYNSIIYVHDFLTGYLSYTQSDNPTRISTPFAKKNLMAYWICEIELWFYLPDDLQKKIRNYSPHIVPYKDTRDFITGTGPA